MARRDKGYATAIYSGGGLRCREECVASRVLAFLRNEGNRALLAWIGGGLVMLATGLWTVFIHFYPTPEAKPAPLQKQIEADCGSVAIGGDVSGATITAGSSGDCPKSGR
jgi:hypothetical protein